MKYRVLVIGIDGATFDIIRPLAAKGKLKNISGLMDSGMWGELKSTIPPITPCAWTSMLTGRNPGAHGIYDFYHLDDDYNIRINSYGGGPVKRIWDYLSDEGRSCCVVNVPYTYPPQKVNGFMVSGFMTPGLDSDFTHPLNLKDELLKNIKGFKLIEDSRYSDREEDRKRFLEDILELVDIQLETAKYLFSKREWDFMMVTFMSVDHAQHWYWKYMDSKMDGSMEPDGSEYETAVEEVYSRVDNAIGELIKSVPDDAVVLLVSDHGCGPSRDNVVLNKWLRDRGYLSLKDSGVGFVKRILFKAGITPLSLVKAGLGRFGHSKKAKYFKVFNKLISLFSFSFKDIDWSKTRAYSFGSYGGIFANLKGRQPKGIVEPGRDHEQLLSSLQSDLEGFEDPVSGERLVDRVWRKEELYSGEYLDRMPDLVYSMRDFSYLVAGMFAFVSNKLFVEPQTQTSGNHRLNGVFIASGAGVESMQEIHGLEITDVAPTILDLMGCRVPESMDGKVICDDGR
ncbi:MAG: hypothetical protein GF416_00395 [Candidatus Altiarchaeales archaeon]|nr:hypothetical protein [Candidatus Altiarchaeales archaeon]MBD3415579.1 hypothetical protein [Candidatus Altiarchaeales archaeon]